MSNVLAKNKGLFAVLALAGYFGSYAILWGSREDVMFALTVDRGCIRKTREVPALRSEWIERSALRVPVTVVYWPVNTLLLSQTEWH